MCKYCLIALCSRWSASSRLPLGANPWGRQAGRHIRHGRQAGRQHTTTRAAEREHPHLPTTSVHNHGVRRCRPDYGAALRLRRNISHARVTASDHPANRRLPYRGALLHLRRGMVGFGLLVGVSHLFLLNRRMLTALSGNVLSVVVDVNLQSGVVA